VISLHDFKILYWCGGEISPLTRSDPDSSRRSGKIRDHAVEEPKQSCLSRVIVVPDPRSVVEKAKTTDARV